VTGWRIPSPQGDKTRVLDIPCVPLGYKGLKMKDLLELILTVLALALFATSACVVLFAPEMLVTMAEIALVLGVIIGVATHWVQGKQGGVR
jgi:hypothetical protein